MREGDADSPISLGKELETLISEQLALNIDLISFTGCTNAPDS
jgi:hypothetical protein